MIIFVKTGTPGCAKVDADIKVREWEAICHRRRDFIMIDYQQHRETSRWVFVERRRPFIVTQHCRRGRSSGSSYQVSSHMTLDAAIASARKHATQGVMQRTSTEPFTARLMPSARG